MTDVMSKYIELKKENPKLDEEMVATFIEEMPEEAMILFNKMIYGKHIVDKDMYDEAVGLLKWTDNSGTGAKWSVEDIVRLSGINFDEKDYYKHDYAYMVNRLFAVFNNILSDPSYYLKMARNCLEDVNYPGDPSEKAYCDAKGIISYSKE